MVSFKLLGKTSMTFQHVLNILHIRKVVTQALYCIAIILKPSQHCHTKNYGTKYILRIYVFYIQYIFKSMFLVFSHQYNILFYSVTFVKMKLHITWHAVWNISKSICIYLMMRKISQLNPASLQEIKTQIFKIDLGCFN